jgi:hypothetical protein
MMRLQVFRAAQSRKPYVLSERIGVQMVTFLRGVVLSTGPVLVTLLLPWLKALKVLAVSVVFSGALGTVIASNPKDRSIFAYYLFGPGLLVTWAVGLVLTWAAAVELFSVWLLGSMGLSLVSLNAVLYIAGKENRRNKASVALTVVPLVLTVILMIVKPWK